MSVVENERARARRGGLSCRGVGAAQSQLDGLRGELGKYAVRNAGRGGGGGSCVRRRLHPQNGF